jgi:hypothetical protein
MTDMDKSIVVVTTNNDEESVNKLPEYDPGGPEVWEKYKSGPPPRKRKPNAPQKLVVGVWDEDETQNTVFFPNETQPPEPITDMAKMVQWCRETFKDPQTLAFIREVPGHLLIARQETLALEWKED